MKSPVAHRRVVASIEARMGSSRLPGKVLMDIAGKPVLSRLLDRLRVVPNLEDIVLATTTSPVDDALCDWAESEDLRYWRGSEDDVLRRVVEAHRFMASDVVVEITGDCPLICPSVVELAVDTYLSNDADVVANVVAPMTYPEGTDVQVFALSLLEDVERNISDPAVREHVSLYFYENPELYRLQKLVAHADHRLPGVRLQLDYEEDLAFARRVYTELIPTHGPLFDISTLVALLRERHDLTRINADCVEKSAR